MALAIYMAQLFMVASTTWGQYSVCRWIDRGAAAVLVKA
jgi:hypothetical protein